MEAEKFKKILVSMVGDWEVSYSDDEKLNQIKVSITPNLSGSLSWLVDDQETEKANFNSPDVFHGYFVFTSDDRHYIRHADENILILGEFEGSALMSRRKWEYTFKRAS